MIYRASTCTEAGERGVRMGGLDKARGASACIDCSPDAGRTPEQIQGQNTLFSAILLFLCFFFCLTNRTAITLSASPVRKLCHAASTCKTWQTMNGGSPCAVQQHYAVLGKLSTMVICVPSGITMHCKTC